MFSLERVGRGVLALTIVGTIPLSMWGSGCSNQPLVQPDAGQSGGSPGTGGVPGSGGVPGTGGVLGTGGHASGGSSGTGGRQLQDASADSSSQCCTSLFDTAQCSPDGTQVRRCNEVYNSDQCLGSSGYSYIWEVQTCPDGCVQVDAGGFGALAAQCRGTGGSSGTGGVSGTGGGPPVDASAESVCCSQSQSLTAQCTPDGKQLRYCNYSLTYGATAQCRAASTDSYAYVWGVQTCPNGCVSVDAGQAGTSAKCE
jgi:hypothetical protein